MTTTQHDSETPAYGQQVITACAFIHHNFDGTEKVFLPKRASTKKFLPGVYELPGGHVDYGENIIFGLQREIMEEFEMRLKVGDVLTAFDYMNHVKGCHSAEIIYFAEFQDPIEHIHLNPEDHSEYGWFAEDELDQVIAENNHKDGGDPEIIAIRRGFALLRGESPRFS